VKAPQFAFQQRLRERGAADCHEGLQCSQTVAVNRARHQFFTGAAFPQDEYGRVRRRYAGNAAAQFDHFRAVAKQIGLDVQVLFEPLDLALQPFQMKRVLDCQGCDLGDRRHQLEIRFPEQRGSLEINDARNFVAQE
jgi:hypothetical protein